MQTNATATPSADQVADWRQDQLVGAGFAPALAARIACDPRYDVHALIELVERGCRPDLAVRIVAPLDEKDGS